MGACAPRAPYKCMDKFIIYSKIYDLIETQLFGSCEKNKTKQNEKEEKNWAHTHSFTRALQWIQFDWIEWVHACACQRTCRARTQTHTRWLCVHARSGPARNDDDDDDDYSNAQLQLLYNLLLWLVLRFLCFFFFSFVFTPFSSQLPVSIVLAPMCMSAVVYTVCCFYFVLACSVCLRSSDSLFPGVWVCVFSFAAYKRSLFCSFGGKNEINK